MTDVKKLITEHLDIWLTAETEKKLGRGRSSGSSNSIYGVQKLRELILDLAFKGKLSNRNSSESSQALITELNEVKQKLIDKGVIKKPKKLPAEEKYIIPSNWTWLTLQDYLDVRDGTHDTPKYIEEGYPLITSKNISSGKLDFKDVKYISKEDHESISIRSKVEFGDILFAMIGSIGNPVLVDTYQEFSVKNVALFKPYQLDITNIRYVLKYLIYITDHLKANAQGAVQSFVSLNALRNTPIPIPPLEEQQRIVAKVDELMQLCDQLEQQQNLSSEAHDQLVDTLLSVLTNSSDVDEFQQNWQRISENFDLLFTTEYSVEQLKQTILQLAVMGKLVKQDPNDDPASELLKQIAEEKARLVKEGKIKKSKLLPQIDLDKVPFEIPDSWVWARFSELGEFGRGKSKHRPRNDPALFNPPIYPLVQTGEVARAGNIILEYHSKYSEIGLAQSRMWSKGTLCITIAANIADSAILGFDACFPDSVVGFTPIEPLHSARYLLFFMKTARQQLLEYAPATAQKNINLEILESVYIPVPPLNEQERIIQTVDEFLNICNTLKDKIRHINSIKCEISDALVSNALNYSNSSVKHKTTDNVIQFEKPIEAVKHPKQKSADQIDLFADDSVEDDIKLLCLAAEITFQLHKEPTFGHLKLQKLIYLCQQLKHMDLAADFKQHAAGPYDRNIAIYIDTEFKKRQWFSYHKDETPKYKQLKKCGDHKTNFEKFFAEEELGIYDLIGLFTTCTSGHIEIVATLFACWLRLLEKKQSVSEGQLLKDFYAWSEEKRKFSKDEVLNGYKWMQQYSVIPQP